MKHHAEYALLLVTIIAAAGWLFSKNALVEMEAFNFVALRFSIASMVLAIFCIPQFKRLTLKHFIKSVATGTVLGLTLLLWIIGLKNTSSIGESSFIISLTVITVPIVGWIVFLDRTSLSIVYSLIPAIAGLALLTLDNGFKLEFTQSLFLIATLGFALHLNLSNHFVKDIPSLANTAIQLAVASGIAALAIPFKEQLSVTYKFETWCWLLASALLGTSVRFALQNFALKNISPSHASMIMTLEPIWVAILGTLFLSEVMSTNQIAGCALIFMALLTYRSKSIYFLLIELKSNKVGKKLNGRWDNERGNT